MTYDDCQCPYCEGCIEVKSFEELEAERQLSWCEPVCQMKEGVAEILCAKTRSLQDSMHLAFHGLDFSRVMTRPLSSYYSLRGEMADFYKADLAWQIEDLPLFNKWAAMRYVLKPEHDPAICRHAWCNHANPCDDPYDCQLSKTTWGWKEVSTSITIKK